MPSKKGPISTTGLTPVKLKVADLSDHDEVEDKGSFTIEYPFKIQIKMGDKVVADERTTSVLKPKNWFKKFYVYESAKNGNRYPSYTRDHTLLAIVKLMKTEIGSEFDPNSIIGFEFEGMVVEMEDGTAFIDWYSTFQYNEIPVPTLGDLEQDKKEVKEVFKDMEDDEDDVEDELPF